MRARRRTRGAAVVDALAGAALAGVALAGLAAVGALTVYSLRLARDTGIALALATERLEALRAGPRDDGEDTTSGPDGTAFRRTWSHAGGRGEPVGLAARVESGRRAVGLETEAYP
jgi:hypothetical protein